MSQHPNEFLGSSEERNEDYKKSFNYHKYFSYLVKNDTPIIFDVGGHLGESVIFFNSIFPNSTIYSFEPDSDNFQKLAKNFVRDNVFYFNIALSDEVGVYDFYKQDKTHLGSLYPVNKNSKDSIGYAKNAINQKTTVKTTTLDEFSTEHSINSVDILKIDVQGAELKVLLGAKSTLKTTKCISMEISLFDFYGNQKDSFAKITKILSEEGFFLWDIMKISKNPQNFRTDWIEAVYIREEIFAPSA